jgi:SAM-dependent methyltransferase
VDREDWDRRYDTAEFIWDVKPNRFLAEELAGPGHGRALDLACGEGRNAIWLAEQGWRTTGVDFSAVAVAKGRQLAESRGVSVELLVEDVVAWVPPAAAFDLVIVFYLQVPGPERATVFAHARQALAPGGTFLLVAHDRSNVADGWGGPQDPGVCPTPDEVVEALTGFEIVRAGVVDRPVEVDGVVRVAKDTLVRALAPAR